MARCRSAPPTDSTLLACNSSRHPSFSTLELLASSASTCSDPTSDVDLESTAKLLEGI